MARKKKEVKPAEEIVPAEIVNQEITDAIRINYMPYAMTVIISRAIPEIDGFKPAHRKLLYTMYTMGLLNPSASRAKSQNVVGATMKLNPHGDAAIYDTLVRLTTANESLLHPFVDSKGTFGKKTSTMSPSAPRYTEVKLAKISNEIFSGIDKNAVDMIPNFDNTMLEPRLLPTSFPNILVSANLGVAVGQQSQICSFNLAEVCDATIALLRNPKVSIDRMLEILKAPDFSTGASYIYERDKLAQIYETGYGPLRLRSKYRYDKSNNLIEITEIPYTTTIESIIERITSLIKEGKFKEISDVRDETGLEGFKLTIDIKRGTDPDLLMAKLFKSTTLEDTFTCNFNVIVDGVLKLLGVREILLEWIRFRMDCVRRELKFELDKKKQKLHLLRALGKILLDIDKAIKIIRNTEKDADVIPRLMEGFSIDKVQAEYIAEIKLRHLNREYILDRIKEIESIQKEISDLETIISDDLKIKGVIAKQLQGIKEKYGIPRKTEIIENAEEIELPKEEEVPNYPIFVLLSKEGYFKKITKQSIDRADEQKLKEGDVIINSENTENRAEILFFTNQAQVYKAKANDFDPVKASQNGDYVPSKLQFAEGEKPVMMKAVMSHNEKDNYIFIFENGKGVRIPANVYETKQNRKKLTNAFSAASPIVAVVYESSPVDLFIKSNDGKGILISSKLIPQKSTRTSQGVTVFALNAKKGQKVVSVTYGDNIDPKQSAGCKKIKIPAKGVLCAPASEQLTL